MASIVPAAYQEDESDACAEVRDIYTLLGDKWSMLVLFILGDGSMRFSELHRAVGFISQRMLTRTVRQLEREGFVGRVESGGVPPRVDYSLTSLGGALLLEMQPLATWAMDHRPEIMAARQRYDVIHSPASAGSHATGEGSVLP